MILENIAMALSAIRINKMRSFLTMLGIIIGIGSVIAIVSIGESMRGVLADQFKSVGETRAMIYPSWYSITDFRDTDYFNLDEMARYQEVFADQIEYIDSNAFVDAEAVSGRNKVKFNFQGIDYHYSEVQPVNMIYGRFLNQGDILGRNNNIVMEENGAIKLFGTSDAVGRTFRAPIYGTMVDFRVVGVYKKQVSVMEALMQMGSTVEAGFIPYTLLTWPNDRFGYLNIYAKKGVDMDKFSDQVLRYTAKLKGRDASQFVFESAAQQMSSMDSMMQSMSLAVGTIAGISLLVGGIGIMNIMLVSVTERTQEIGIRKALGARTKDVLIQFLTEAAIISAMGGIIGVLMGVGLVSGGGALLGVPTVISPGVIVLAVAFSALIGIFFGLYPASKAAQKDPIDALRFE